MGREKFASRLGFILISAGCAIGIGNVWRFPYVVGQNGGGLFVLIYLFFLLIMGVPVLTMEYAIGRAGQQSPLNMLKPLEPKGTKWHYHGKFALAANYLLMMFYTTVAGWMLYYFVVTGAGGFENQSAAAITQTYKGMLQDPLLMYGFTAIVIIFALVICSFSLQKGLERITKYMMIALLVIMVVLAINSISTEGGREGLKFYLMPDFDKVQEVGIINVIVNALNQAFFTLGIGIGGMAIMGSYVNKDRRLAGEAVTVTILDTFVAVCSGLIIFPACFTYGIQPDSGPDLIFITLPNIFANLPGGRFWGSLFFLFLSFAALSTVFAVFEVLVSSLSERFNLSRRKSSILNGLILLVASLPCVLGFNLIPEFNIFNKTFNVQGIEDFLVSNVLLPLGSLVIVLFCTHKKGWGMDNFLAEANQGKGIISPKAAYRFLKYILPVIIIALFTIGIYNTLVLGQ